MKIITNLKTGESYPYASYTFLREKRTPLGFGDNQEMIEKIYILKTEVEIPCGMGHKYKIEDLDIVIFPYKRLRNCEYEAVTEG